MPRLIEVGGCAPQIHPTAWVAPGATLAGKVVVGERANIWFGAVLRADQGFEIRVGARSSIQDNAVIHTDHRQPTLIGEGVTIGHGVSMEGCVIGDGALIGMNAVVLPGAKVGEGALVAAGAVVLEGMEIPPGVLAAGMPAKVKKVLDGDALAHVRNAALVDYQRLMDLYGS